MPRQGGFMSCRAAFALLFLSGAALAQPAPDEEADVGDVPLEPRDVRAVPFAAFTSAISDQSRVFYGLLHAHTFFSDGSGTPTEAFKRARSKRNDFFGVTEHNHKAAEMGASDDRLDKVLIATTPGLYNSDSPVTVTRRFKDGTTKTVTVASLKTAAKSITTTKFTALWGQEFSTITSGGNHVNVFGVPEVLTIPNGDHRTLFDTLSGLGETAGFIPLVQFNHPASRSDLFSRTPKNHFDDYGFDDYHQDFSEMVGATDKFVALVEVLTGPAMAEVSEAPFHYGKTHELDYYYYLCQGFHISPSVGHDNHYKTWGDATPARMGVWATSVDEKTLILAMHDNRTFATEDRDLQLQLFVGGFPMGRAISPNAADQLRVVVQVTDPTDDSDYEIELVRGDVAPQRRSALEKLDPDDGVVDRVRAREGLIELAPQLPAGTPEFFYVRLKQLGDGDQAWSAPVWINHPR
jgi:hypothetical protein